MKLDRTRLAVLRGASDLPVSTIGEPMLPHYKALMELGLVEIDHALDEDATEIVNRTPAGDFVLQLHDYFDPPFATVGELAEAITQRDALNREALDAYETWSAEQGMDPAKADNTVPWAFAAGYIACTNKLAKQLDRAKIRGTRLDLTIIDDEQPRTKADTAND